MEDRLDGTPKSRIGLGRVCCLLVVALAALGAFTASASASGWSPEASLSIEALQEISGSGSAFTTAEVSGKVGQTVDYKILVKNTGSSATSLSDFSDAHCESGTLSGGTGGKELAPDETTSYTCSHHLAEAASVANTATIMGTVSLCFSTTFTSNTTTVKVPNEPAFTVRDEQKLAGEASYTTAKLTGKVGEVVDYKVTVTDTGTVPLKLAKITDSDCSNIVGPGKSELAPGESTTYSCEHALAATGTWYDVAEVESCSCNLGKTETSNKVEVEVPAEEAFTVLDEQKIGSAGSYTTATLSAKTGETVLYRITVTDTGTTAVKLEHIYNPNCTNIVGPGKSQLSPGEATTYTCEHTLASTGTWLNEAGVESASHKVVDSNRVTAEATAAPQAGFSVVKEQKIEGEANFTKSKLTGKIGEVVEYRITVANTGNMTIRLDKITDTHCTNIVGPGKAELAAGESTTYSCEHELTATGIWTNVAEVESCSCDKNKTEVSNKVEVEVPAEEAFKVLKEQKLGASSSYTTSKLTGALGETVSYRITVTNIGNVALTLEKITDPNCTNIVGPAKGVLAPAEATTYTCEHLLSAVGTWVNEAAVEGNHKTEHSNKVEVEVPAQETFKVEKEQKISGEAAYTKTKLVSKLGATVDYEIIVTNTGNVALTLEKITDPNCTNIVGPAKGVLAPAEATTYTCEHLLSAVGTWVNEAAVEGNHKTEHSNKVEVEVPAEEAFKVIKEQKLSASGSYTTSKLVSEIAETVLYRITVTNTGNMPVTLESITDPNCTHIVGPGEGTLAIGASTTYTCEHKLTAMGIWTNTATVEGNHKTETTNTVEVEVKEEEEPSFEVIKEQKLGAASSYTKHKLTGKLGETVDYQITVKNTGNVPITLESFTDANCTHIVGPGKSELAVGGSTTYTCDHKLTSTGTWTNVASVEGSHKTEKSNKVEVEVPATETFTVEKEQKLSGEGTFTTSKLTGKLGETVDYEIIVTNTGEAALKLEKMTDANCTGISGPGKTQLAAGESTTYTCEHVLTSVGTWTNEAEVEGNHKTEKTNKVEVEVPAVEAFTVEKEQKLSGEGAFTTSKLTGKLGETVDYEIIVTNTGNVALTLEKMTDANCTGISGPGKTQLAAGESTTYTCEHVLTSVGTWTNEAEVEGNHKTGKTNKVEVEVPAVEAFKVEKEQKLSGEGAFTTSKLTGKLGETVDYEIIVTDTGNTSVTLEKMTDANCTGISGPGKTQLAPGESTTYTCEHVLASVGTWTNEAEVEGNHKPQKSNKVEVEAPQPKQEVKPECKLSESQFVLSGGSGAQRKPFTVSIQSLGIKQITFYLDGHKLKTLSAAQAKNGKFSITINPGRLSYGAHKVSVKTVMTDSLCTPIARSSVFVHPHQQKVTPKFTG